MLSSHQEQFHLRITSGQIGRYCILPGDPGRCEKIAAYLEAPRQISQNREYNIFTGTLDGVPVTVCSTGIGGPSTAIAVEELVNCGADTLIRVGTCGGISLRVRAGDVVIASGAVRQDGTSREYAPSEFPAVSDPDVLFALRESARAAGFRAHTGIVQSKDAFYGQHNPEQLPTCGELLAKWEAWKRLGVLASEMEASTLYTVAAYRGVRAGAVFHTIWNQELAGMDPENGQKEDPDTDRAIRTAIGAIRLLIREDRKKENENHA